MRSPASWRLYNWVNGHNSWLTHASIYKRLPAQAPQPTACRQRYISIENTTLFTILLSVVTKFLYAQVSASWRLVGARSGATLPRPECRCTSSYENNKVYFLRAAVFTFTCIISQGLWGRQNYCSSNLPTYKMGRSWLGNVFIITIPAFWVFVSSAFINFSLFWVFYV